MGELVWLCLPVACRASLVATAALRTKRTSSAPVSIGGLQAANVYTAASNTWALNSHTPNEFQLATGQGVVTVR
jgi:hypothetical protein